MYVKQESGEEKVNRNVERKVVVVVVETIRIKVEVTKTMVVKVEVVPRRVNMVVEETRMVTVTTTTTTGVKKSIQWVELGFNL